MKEMIPEYRRVAAFRKNLEDLIKSSGEKIASICRMYLHLFSILSLDETEELLDRHAEVASGHNEFWGKEGKTQWFAAFHKELRQCDWFQDTYRRTDGDEKMTKEQKSEYFHLMNVVTNDGYNKKGTDGELFNPEYRRYMYLGEIKRAQFREKSLGGILDMLLYNLIKVDDDILYNAMEAAFKAVPVTKPKTKKKSEKVLPK